MHVHNSLLTVVRTLLVYLTGVEDGVEGGETVFYPEARVMSKQGSKSSSSEARISLSRGLALLHRHGHECALHEGAAVLKGTKWVLRSDVGPLQAGSEVRSVGPHEAPVLAADLRSVGPHDRGACAASSDALRPTRAPKLRFVASVRPTRAGSESRPSLGPSSASSAICLLSA